MNPPSSKPKKSLLRWLLKIGLIALLLLLLVAVVAGLFGVWYLGSDRVKTFDNIAFFGGGSLSVGRISISEISDYPEIDITVHNLHVWEKERTSPDSAFFVMNEGRLRLRADLLNSDTILLRQITYKGGRLNLVKDDHNHDAAERMLHRRPPPQGPGPRFKIIGSPDLLASIALVDLRLANPIDGKETAGFIKSMDVSDLHLGKDKHANAEFDVDVKGLTFNAREGAYAQNTRLRGTLNFEHIGNRTRVTIPDLVAGETPIAFSATLFPGADSITTFHFNVPSVDLQEVRPMLSPGLQDKVKNFDVDGPFYADLEVQKINVPGAKPEVKVDLRLRGNRAKVEEFIFNDTYLNGTFVNRLPAKQGDFHPDEIGSIFKIDTVAAHGFGFDFTTVDAEVISRKGEGSSIQADVVANGSAKSLSDLLKSDQFLFTKGQVDITASLLGPLSDVTQLLNMSDGSLVFARPSVRLVDAGVQLPLKHLTLDKEGNTAKVDLEGFTPAESHAFRIYGDVTGISRVIGGSNPAPIVSAVKVESNHLSWADLAVYLGTQSQEPGVTPDLETVSKKGFDPVALKSVLTSIESSFQPELEIDVDTLSYLDVQLTSFKTGLHFRANDTLVLERTTFLIDTATVGFGGSIHLGAADRTSYEFSLNAEHVDVEDLLPKINFLGSTLLEGLSSHPNDVDIEVSQLGFIHDQDGILPNSSTGYIDLVSNKQKAFRARVDFEPERPDEPDFNSTRVSLEGNAVLFNDFFDTEDFVFQDGDFAFYMAYAGLVPDIKSLMQEEIMTLDYCDGRVLFKSADIEIPINALTLDMLRDTAEVELYLRSEELDQALRVVGVANNLSEVVLGETGKQFSTTAKVESERIVWSDLNALIGTFAGERDTTADLNLRKTTRAIMTKFQPNVTLSISELELNHCLSIQNVESGLRMNEDQRLFVDTTGFNYGDGSLHLAGSIDLKKLELTPFNFYLNTEELDVASLLYGFDHFGVTSLKEARKLEGKMSLKLTLDGDILGESGNLLRETASGSMDFSFSDLQVDGLQQIDVLAEKFSMTNRLENLTFATLKNRVSLDTNTVHLPLMEIPSSAFRVFLAGDMELGNDASFWVSVPLANLKTPDSTLALVPAGYADKRYKLHLEFLKESAQDPLETKLRWSRRKYYKQRQKIANWRADKKSWREERKRDR